ncbi:MAG TPA: hypothetical protein VHF06_14915 [Pseudonocardiaceae bacterium]|jgi:hypothetical protein|nr:hypothetical protein [Pseudonocardiaceae bacterium]
MFDDTHTTDIDRMLDHGAPANDVADQLRPARHEPTDDEQTREQALSAAGQVLEADPSDVADQLRDAPVIDETEPWP